MNTRNVVAGGQKPTAEELVRIYETFDDGQSSEIRRQFRDGALTTAHIQAVIEHRNPFAEAAESLKAKAVRLVHQTLKIVNVGAVKSQKTAGCFTTARYSYRDSDLNKFLPENQPDQAGSQFGVLGLTEPATLKEFVESVLGTQGGLKTPAKLIKERGLTTTLPTIEALVERQEGGEDIGLRTDGWANFFFVDNEGGKGVSVVLVCRRGVRWSVCQFSLGYGGRW